jgi:hypothetical protein
MRLLYRKNGRSYLARSSWERAVMDYLDQQGIPFEYEPKKFAVAYKFGRTVRKGWYLPDFYLPTLGVWWEIKGRFTVVAQAKVRAFRETYPEERLEVLKEKDLLALGIRLAWTPEERAHMRRGVWPFE